MLLQLFLMSVMAAVNNQTLAVLVNQNDPESIEIAKYYQRLRLIPDEHIIYLDFPAQLSALTKAQFEKVEIQLKKKVPEKVQAYALAWRKPWRVDCMSITSAFSLGFSNDYCATGCKVTKPVKYYNSLSDTPYTDFKIRPSMLLSASNVEGVKKLIKRGVSADYTRPYGTAYLLSTNDKQRNVRSVSFAEVKDVFSRMIGVDVINADAIKNKKDVLFYFSGNQKVKWIDDNEYLPGAIADHLTSAGGQLFNGRQMSVLKWIDAGVTGTYGTVVEPCNFIPKFPHPNVVIGKYLSGDSLIEAYWKSVLMPGQGVFVGEPLASPFKGCKLLKSNADYFRRSKNIVKNYVENISGNCN